jgi:hypothetical protein
VNCPTEYEEQRAVIEWARAMRGRFPELRLLYSTAQDGHLPRLLGKLKAAGFQFGVPDLHLPIARRGFHGLWLEMKRQKGGRLSDDQRAWVEALHAAGHRVEICKGADAAIQVLFGYLEG